MISDPTYDFQINQLDRRTVFGGRFERTLDHRTRASRSKPASKAVMTTSAAWPAAHGRWGVSTPIIGRYGSRGRLDRAVRRSHVERDRQAAPHGRPARGLLFLRRDPQSCEDPPSGDKSDDIVSPKLGVAYALTDAVELYGNWGRGFHSNDARGVAAPPRGNDPVPGLVRGTGQEVGARFQRGNFTFTTTYWWLDLASELKFVGDSNSVEPSTADETPWLRARRLLASDDWLARRCRVDAAAMRTREDSPGLDHVPGAIESAGELGISADAASDGKRACACGYLGPYPLIEDNSLRASSDTVVNLRAAWKARRDSRSMQSC